jgi:hypothetical protein
MGITETMAAKPLNELNYAAARDACFTMSGLTLPPKLTYCQNLALALTYKAP